MLLHSFMCWSIYNNVLCEVKTDLRTVGYYFHLLSFSFSQSLLIRPTARATE